MDKFEEIRRDLDEGLTRLREFVEEEVAPETEKRTAIFLREVSEKLTEAAGWLEKRRATRQNDASNGEIYDMNKLTAAHRTLPFDSMVRVTNLSNGKTTTVRITDRGPFVDNRIIDLSRAAAQEIESIGPGIVPVRIEVLSGPDPAAGFFTVQGGAFKEKGNADRLKERLSTDYSPIYIQQVVVEDGAFYRVRVGRVSGEQEAQRLGDE